MLYELSGTRRVERTICIGSPPFVIGVERGDRETDLHERERGQKLTERLDADQLHHDLSRSFHERVIVTQDGSRVFLYSGTREQAEKVRSAIEDEARARNWLVDIDLKQWHPDSEEWMEPEIPLPADDSEKRVERDQLMARERKETEERGYPEFEVRVDLPSHRDALKLVTRLKTQNVPTVHRWRYVLVGAADEDSADILAERIRAMAPKGTRLPLRALGPQFAASVR